MIHKSDFPSLPLHFPRLRIAWPSDCRSAAGQCFSLQVRSRISMVNRFIILSATLNPTAAHRDTVMGRLHLTGSFVGPGQVTPGQTCHTKSKPPSEIGPTQGMLGNDLLHGLWAQTQGSVGHTFIGCWGSNQASVKASSGISGLQRGWYSFSHRTVLECGRNKTISPP